MRLRKTVDLTSEERRQRIAELLCKAIHYEGAKQATSGPAMSAPASGPAPKPPPPTEEERVLRYLNQVGQTTPLTLRTALGIPRTTMYRILLRLSQQGLVGTAGTARAATVWLVNRGEGESGQGVATGPTVSLRSRPACQRPRITP